MTKDMTQGSPLKLILAFAVPLMLGSLFQQFYNLADTIIVGRFVGVEALAAVGSVGGLNYLVLGFVNGIACGFSIPISWTFGAKDYKEMRRYTANTVWLSIFFAVVLTIVTVALTRSVLVWTNTPENIIDLADIYIRTIFAGIPFTLLYNVTSALMRALGDSKRPLYFLLVASFLNIGLDLVCIIVFQMGAFGAAFATVVSQAVAGLGSLLYILRHYPELRWSREEGCFSLTHCAKLCSMGIPMGLQCSITAIGSVVLQGAVNGLGSDIVAAQTAGGKAAQFLSVPLESIGTAMTTYASQNLGAHDLKRVNRGVNTALGIGCVYSIASFIILRFADKLLIGLFLDAGEVEIMDGTFEIIDGDSFIAEPTDVTELLGTDDLISHQNEFVSFTGMTVEAAGQDADGNDVAFLYNWDGSGSEGDDLYFNASYNGETYTFTIESYLCDNTTEVYSAVKNLEIGQTIDMEGFLYWYEGVNPHITAVTVVE